MSLEPTSHGTGTSITSSQRQYGHLLHRQMKTSMVIHHTDCDSRSASASARVATRRQRDSPSALLRPSSATRRLLYDRMTRESQSVGLPVACLLACLPARRVPACLPPHLSTRLPATYLPACLPVCLHAHSAYTPTRLPARLLACLPACPRRAILDTRKISLTKMPDRVSISKSPALRAAELVEGVSNIDAGRIEFIRNGSMIAAVASHQPSGRPPRQNRADVTEIPTPGSGYTVYILSSSFRPRLE